ncbi:hypothetical protein QTP70_002852 [Hemibagrus guttatus]|uniref:Reverse transcriptase domain-containing protein n=1 Tax=Hemibagrus guttatus TaxID=175788 RepID=A0AAE0QRT7_9TELE|nr:hypothetical protein QTP70_002852 [Hemibagrus guttatus]
MAHKNLEGINAIQVEISLGFAHSSPPERCSPDSLEVRDAVKLKKEYYQAWLARETPEAAEAYQKAKRTAAGVVSEAKTRVWEEFGEAMEKDYRTASGKFWQTLRCLRRWEEYFEDLLNPTDTPSVEEPEAEESKVDSFITQADATEVVQQLLGGKAPGVDEIRPEYLKSLDVVGLSWLTRLCNIAWRSGTVPLDWATGVVIPLFKKGDRRKAFDRVPRGILWEVLWEYGVPGPLLWAVRSLYNRSKSLVRIASYDVVLLAPSSLDLQHALGRFAAKCEAAGMRVSTSKLEAMVLDRKKVACTLQVGGEVLPQVEEFKCLGVLFTSEGRMDREIDRRIRAAAAVMRSMYRSVVVKKELSRKAKPSIYQSIYVPTLTYGHELWVMTERNSENTSHIPVKGIVYACCSNETWNLFYNGNIPWILKVPYRTPPPDKKQDRYVARTDITWAPPWSQAWGWGTQVSAWWPSLCLWDSAGLSPKERRRPTFP